MPIPPEILNRITTEELADALAQRMGGSVARTLHEAREIDHLASQCNGLHRDFAVLPQRFVKLVEAGARHNRELETMMREATCLLDTLKGISQRGAAMKEEMRRFKEDAKTLIPNLDNGPQD